MEKPHTPASPEEQQKQEEERRAMEERKRVILRQILEPAASERLYRVALVKPEKAQAVENQLIRMATSGAMSRRIDEGMLVSLLEQVTTDVQPKVTVQRRRRAIEEDDD
eukprot:Polyplicarium_translucidae@DN1696_c0_g1_i1.p3